MLESKGNLKYKMRIAKILSAKSPPTYATTLAHNRRSTLYSQWLFCFQYAY